MIRESILVTLREDGAPHIAPLGVIWDADGGGRGPVLAPFHPSATLDNLRRHPFACVCHTEDVRVFAGCLTGRRDWPTHPAERIAGRVLEGAHFHQELAVERVEEDPQRPRFRCRVVHEALHAPFRGFNRAQAAVIEGAILVSRLHMLPAEKVEREMEYLTTAVSKTAGPREHEAWSWLVERVSAHRAGAAA